MEYCVGPDCGMCDGRGFAVRVTDGGFGVGATGWASVWGAMPNAIEATTKLREIVIFTG